MNKGGITTGALMWGAGLVTTALVSLSGYFVNITNKTEARVYNLEQGNVKTASDIASLKTDMTNVKDTTRDINAKLDIILQKQGLIYNAKLETNAKK